ncbi:hypothetical protein O9G_003839 [Rozella allomycis CSF55]|uniref:Uncharacterized protein n=1 Tax=Rozella allomycis (strain CSF55) TaxID=988480 RepID=A0A075ARW7_ROZAC|nr:hypothetical protein O9G_003839 [Rozella allomycis CSF55]|eukprot:EPZ33016.1 hypothetical protein O9G_003839 [Rozella allomycis CSF55]
MDASNEQIDPLLCMPTIKQNLDKFSPRYADRSKALADIIDKSYHRDRIEKMLKKAFESNVDRDYIEMNDIEANNVKMQKKHACSESLTSCSLLNLMLAETGVTITALLFELHRGLNNEYWKHVGNDMRKIIFSFLYSETSYYFLSSLELLLNRYSGECVRDDVKEYIDNLCSLQYMAREYKSFKEVYKPLLSLRSEHDGDWVPQPADFDNIIRNRESNMIRKQRLINWTTPLIIVLIVVVGRLFIVTRKTK